MKGENVLTSSALATARACLRKYEISYLEGVRPVETAGTLRFGTAVHRSLECRWGMQGSWANWANQRWFEDDFEAVKMRAMMTGYDARWADDFDLYEVVHVEVPFEARMRTAVAHSPKWKLAGKLDGIIRERATGRVLILEHKTTSEDIRLGSDYWTRLRMDAQVSIYYDGAKALGYDVVGVLYDVLAKPDLRPLKATPVESRKFTKDGRLYANQREQDETPEEYEARLLAAIAAEPERYYQRAEVVRLESEIAASRRDVWQTSRLIASGHYPRNVDACMRYGRACAYLPACSGAGSLDDETRYRRVDDVHPEIGGDE